VHGLGADQGDGITMGPERRERVKKDTAGDDGEDLGRNAVRNA